MTGVWVSSEDAAKLKRRGVNLVILFRMALASGYVVRLWAGHGDFPIPVDGVETEAGAIYSGAGELNDVEELSQAINGEADRVSFMTSGIGETAAAIADQDANEIEGSPVRIGVVVLDEQLQSATPVAWLWSGECDVVEPNYDGMSDPPTFSLSIEVATAQATRKKGALLYWTPPQQRSRSADDAFCDNVSKFVNGYTIAWPLF